MKYKLQNGILQLSLPGDVLSTGVPELRRAFAAILALADVQQSGWKTIELDLAHAKMIDSMGLNMLVSLLRTAQERGGGLRVSIRDRNLDRLFRFTRLTEHVEIVHV